jgi:hypothetical protein
VLPQDLTDEIVVSDIALDQGCIFGDCPAMPRVKVVDHDELTASVEQVAAGM